MKWIGAFALLVGISAPPIADAQVVHQTGTYYDDGGSAGAGASRRDEYRGGLNTLPYGHTVGYDAAIAAHALTMPSVQCAMQRMAARGYVRRADGDVGCTDRGYAVAVLAYEKPGVPVGDAFPAVMVHTHPYYVNSRLKWVPVTQVACGIFRDSSGTVVPTSTPGDSAMLISTAQGASGIAPGEIERAMLSTSVDQGQAGIADTYRWAYTAHEYFSNPPTFGLSMTPGQQYYWQQYGVRVGGAAVGAGMSYARQWYPPPVGQGWQGGIIAMAIAGCTAHYQFMMSPPDTTNAYP